MPSDLTLRAVRETSRPPSLVRLRDGDEQAQFDIGVEFAIGQCRSLLEQGVPGIHFYVLNKSQACEEILAAYDFRNQVDRRVFELHTKGLSSRQIQTAINEEFDQTLDQRTISRTINRARDSYTKGR